MRNMIMVRKRVLLCQSEVAHIKDSEMATPEQYSRPLPGSPVNEIWFKMLAVGAIVAAFYHLAAALGQIPGNTSPLWRHLLFVGIDIVLAIYLLKRPVWGFPFFCLLFLQQAVSHGEAAIRRFRAGQIDTISIIDLSVLAIALILLIVDLRGRLKSGARR
jgi:hypothetical protein